jgi:hypothetical protein
MRTGIGTIFKLVLHFGPNSNQESSGQTLLVVAVIAGEAKQDNHRT